jgi:hypothetical protein
MINVNRGLADPDLAVVKVKQLELLRKLGRVPLGTEISGYRIVVEKLWKAQWYKCCYCERKTTWSFNDIDHFRPKGSANRMPGCAQRHGYWWLAFDWDNLLFSCSSCNRSAKNDRFPTRIGSVSLQAEELPPGKERPLLLDPSGSENPVEHIQFNPLLTPDGLDWWATARGGSEIGAATIEICKMNNAEFRELRRDHFLSVISPVILDINEALEASQYPLAAARMERMRELLRPRSSYVAFSYDAFNYFISEARLRAAGIDPMLGISFIGR